MLKISFNVLFDQLSKLSLSLCSLDLKYSVCILSIFKCDVKTGYIVLLVFLIFYYSIVPTDCTSKIIRIKKNKKWVLLFSPAQDRVG